MPDSQHQADAYDAADPFADTAIRRAAVVQPAPQAEAAPCVPTLAATALRVLNASVELGDGLAELARSIDVVVTERDALRKVLQDIVDSYDQTYDATNDGDGVWIAAASIPVEVMHRAEQLLIAAKVIS